jgi:hypothetical protein
MCMMLSMEERSFEGKEVVKVEEGTSMADETIED